MHDFGSETVIDATLAGRAICGVTDTPGCGTTLTIPNWALVGSQQLKVFTSSGNASKNIIIGGPTVIVTPADVVPNQRVSLNGNGFTPNATITNITIGSEPFQGYPIEEGTTSNVRVDNSGRWATSVIIPIVAATVSDGTRAIRVTDSANRHGTANVTIPAREVTISPPSGRVGTSATVRGKNFPALNDDGSPISISIIYEAGAGVTVSGVPNADGSFSSDLRIPTTASPGGTHTVKVLFNYGPNNAQQSVTTVTHDVPRRNHQPVLGHRHPGWRGHGYGGWLPYCRAD